MTPGAAVDWSGLTGVARGQGLAIDAAALDRVERYFAELLRWRSRVNLVGPSDPQRIADELVADAAPLAGQLVPGDLLLDIGAGSGLPGLVVALLRTDVRVELWEPRERRCAFLRAAAQAAGAENVRIVTRRAPEEGLTPRVPHSVLSARAVWRPATWLEIAGRTGAAGARVAVHGPPVAAPAGLRLVRVIEYTLPGDLHRALVLYEILGGANAKPGPRSVLGD